MDTKERVSKYGWFRSSRTGHVVGSQLFYALPMFLFFVYLAYAEGDPFAGVQLLADLLVTSVGSVLFGCLVSFTITSRLLKKLEK